MPGWIGHWLRDTRLLLASQALVALASTVLAIVLARGLGPSDLGLFSALLGLSLALSTFVDLGLGTWLLRGLSRLHEEEPVLSIRQRESARRIIGAGLVNLVLGSILFVVSVVVVVAIDVDTNTAFALLGLIGYTVFLTISNCLEAFLRAERTLRLVVVAVLFEKCLLLLVVGVAVMLNAELWVIALAYLFASLSRLTLLGLTIFVRQRCL